MFMIRPRKKARRKRDSNPGSSALQADALTTRPTRRSRGWDWMMRNSSPSWSACQAKRTLLKTTVMPKTSQSPSSGLPVSSGGTLNAVWSSPGVERMKAKDRQAEEPGQHTDTIGGRWLRGKYRISSGFSVRKQVRTIDVCVDSR